MPFKISWTTHGIEWRHWGAVDFAEVNAANEAFMNDPRSERARCQLIDLREVEEFSVDPEELNMVGAFDVGQSVSTPNLRVAILVPDDRFDAQLAGYEDALKRSSWLVRKFTDEAAARAWMTERR